jgi:hypothetical protein
MGTPARRQGRCGLALRVSQEELGEDRVGDAVRRVIDIVERIGFDEVDFVPTSRDIGDLHGLAQIVANR